MVRESGLSMDSDPIDNSFIHKPIVLNSFPEDMNNNMKGKDIVSNKGSSLTTMPFQVNHSSPATSYETRREMELFKDKNNLDDKVASIPDNDHSPTPRLLEFKLTVSDL